MIKEIVLSGFGGQGVLTVGLIMADIAVARGRIATWIPSYGSAMRGGTANCTVKYGDETIYNPTMEEPDLVLAMNDPSFKMFVNSVRPGGVILTDVELVTCATDERKDISVYPVAASSLAASIGHPKGANMVMTGALIKLLGDFEADEAVGAINEMFAKKGKARFEELNTKAFRLGYGAV